MKVAVDMDGTLAETLPQVFRMLAPFHDYGYDDAETWQWPVEQFGKEAFLSAAWSVWPARFDHIRPSPGASSILRDIIGDHTIDVVTQHGDVPYVSESKQHWLNEHNVPFDNFVAVPMGTTKAGLDYDLYVDDKPALARRVNGDASVAVFDRPYNRDVEGDFRIESFAELPGVVREMEADQ